MTFFLSERSKGRLKGVHPDLAKVVTKAIEVTKVDFGVVQGLRTEEEQKALFEKGATQTMKSNHLKQADGYSHAVDLMAFVDGRGSWEVSLFDDIADAMRATAIVEDVHIRWGGAWTVDDIRYFAGPMEEAMNSYIDTRRSQGVRPFIDAPHFELRGYS